MNRLIFGADDYLKRWAAQRIGIDGFGPSAAIGVQRDGEIIAACVYHDYRDGQIEASIAASSQRWANRSVLFGLFAYPFIQVGAKRMLVTCSEANHKAMKMNRQLGFVEEGRLRKMFGKHDAVLFGMLKQECKWIGVTDGQERTYTTASA